MRKYAGKEFKGEVLIYISKKFIILDHVNTFERYYYLKIDSRREVWFMKKVEKCTFSCALVHNSLCTLFQILLIKSQFVFRFNL